MGIVTTPASSSSSWVVFFFAIATKSFEGERNIRERVTSFSDAHRDFDVVSQYHKDSYIFPQLFSFSDVVNIFLKGMTIYGIVEHCSRSGAERMFLDELKCAEMTGEYSRFTNKRNVNELENKRRIFPRLFSFFLSVGRRKKKQEQQQQDVEIASNRPNLLHGSFEYLSLYFNVGRSRVGRPHLFPLRVLLLF